MHKKPSQTLGFDCLMSHDIRTIAQRSHYELPPIPAELEPIAVKILETQRYLDSLCVDYDLAALRAKQTLIKLTSEEQSRLNELERDKRIQKERKKAGTQLRGVDKFMYRQTGKLPNELQSEMFAEFLKWKSDHT
jgi:hypothetical protein